MGGKLQDKTGWMWCSPGHEDHRLPKRSSPSEIEASGWEKLVMFDISRVLAGIQSASVDLILFSCLIISSWVY